VAPPDVQLNVSATVREPKELLLPHGHVDLYQGENFRCNSTEQLAWFAAHLIA